MIYIHQNLDTNFNGKQLSSIEFRDQLYLIL